MPRKPLCLAFCMGIFATGASAQSLSPGHAQLAALAGVAPDRYSTAQLIQLVEARRENDTTQVRYILDQDGTVVGRSDFVPLPSDAAEGLTLAEQIALADAIREHQLSTVQYIVSGTIRTSVPNPASVVTPGEAQLAGLAGVDPAKFTLAELVAMQKSTTDF